MSHPANRRQFLQHSALTAAAVAGAGSIGAAVPSAQGEQPVIKPKRPAALKLASQEGRIPGDTLEARLGTMEAWGFEGLEVGGKNLPSRVKEIKDALKGRPIKMSAICAGYDGWLIADQKEVRDQAMQSMKDILTAAGEIQSTGLIIVPAFNHQQSLPHRDARVMLTGFHRSDKRPSPLPPCLLQELGDHAVKAGTRILLEPLNRDECYFLRTLADAASICRDLQNPGIAMMGDFWHMTWEETSDLGAFVTAGDHLHHVHMASRRRRQTPGEDGEADNYVLGFKGLKLIGYQDYVSLECGAVGDPNQVIPAAVRLLRDQWAQA